MSTPRKKLVLTRWEGQRWCRITFPGPDGSRQRFEGRWTWLNDDLLAGERKDDCVGADGAMGVTLHLAYLTRADVLDVHREHPVYGNWVRLADLPWGVYSGSSVHSGGQS